MKNTFILVFFAFCSCAVKRENTSQISKIEQQNTTEQNSKLSSSSQQQQLSLTIAKIEQTEYTYDTTGRVRSVVLRKVDFLKKDSVRINDSTLTQVSTNRTSKVYSENQHKQNTTTKPSPVWSYFKFFLFAALALGLVVVFRTIKRYFGL